MNKQLNKYIKIRVLWLCNVVFSKEKSSSTGTWLHSMAESLVATEKIELYSITFSNVKKIEKTKYNTITQWVIPISPISKSGLPCRSTIAIIQSLTNSIQPDLIHVWGTESYWGMLTAKGFLGGCVCLDIQGLIHVIYRYYYSGLSYVDLFRSISLHEILKPRRLLVLKKWKFGNWAKHEKEIIKKHKHVSTQSEWVRMHVKSINPNAHIYKSLIPLRSEFYSATSWKAENCNPYQVFTSVSSPIPYKGLHTLLEAIYLLKKTYAEVQLMIAGRIGKGIRQTGYIKMLIRKIHNLGIDTNVTWLGPLDASSLVQQMHKANVVVIPSYIESYCVSMDEALTIGAPVVAACSGAMPEFSKDLPVALYYQPSDAVMCARIVENLFQDEKLALKISINAYTSRKKVHKESPAQRQIEIYNDILEIENKSNNANKNYHIDENK